LPARHPAWIFLLVLLGLLVDPGTLRAAGEPSAALADFFEKEIRPILVEKCLECHGEKRPKGGLTLASRASVLRGGDSGPAALPGKPDESLLVRAVRHTEKRRMPREKLTDRQIEVLARWVKLGLPWPGKHSTLKAQNTQFTITAEQRRFWSFQPVKPVAVPDVRNTTWARNPIDRFILSALEAKGLSPAAPADKRTLIRRATFDLIGLPPTPEEIDAFLADESPAAFARVVDRLLASPRYGERWGRHWLDVVRYADARDLIQLPPASDFREAWRYRDWVVRSFNDDLPYPDFVRSQIAGDLLGLDGAVVATGLLAIADFVPGDVDKELMIADYVNDQIDVVGRAFLGLTLACARCHDHKFDPISTEDYYGLAGIFFSTRLIPGPVAGNTPLVRVPLWAKSRIDQERGRFEKDKRRLAELQRLLLGAEDREYRATLQRLVTTATARYLVAACEYRFIKSSKPTLSLAAFAGEKKLDQGILAGWLSYLSAYPPGEISSPLAPWRKTLLAAAAGRLDLDQVRRSAGQLEQSLRQTAAREEKQQRSPEKQSLLLHLRADDGRLRTDSAGRVTLWPDRSPLAQDALPVARRKTPLKASAAIKGRDRQVLRFAGAELLEVKFSAPAAGSLFVVCRLDRSGNAGQRLVGWEDSSVGRHGLGLMPAPAGRLHAILRDNGKSGDVSHDRRATGDFEIISVTWGPGGVTLHRDRRPAGTNKSIGGVSSDPSIQALRIGGPGSGGAPNFSGDVAELRIYDQQLDDEARSRIEAELFSTWFTPAGAAPARADSLTELYRTLTAAQGPLGKKIADKSKLLPPDFMRRLAGLRAEQERLKHIRPPDVPMAVAVQEGGPPGTRHAGFREAAVFVRGNHKKPGKIVPRRFPVILAGEKQPAITKGSGRLDLANWLSRPEHPLTARVMVNRIWQHHFGAGLVRTANNFGQRGDHPTHPELLDYLADRFVKSGWSIKETTRLVMLSSTYQQSAKTAERMLAEDPDNRLFGRMNRRRLDAEAIRDSLLAVAGRVDFSMGGPAFAEMATPRRTLYLLSARTGAKTSEFASLFDRADPGAIVEQRSESIVAPQALFFLNDPFVSDQAKALAKRLARESTGPEDTIRRLYKIVFARPPRREEIALGKKLLEPLDRYCHLILCANEFLFVE
jgi:hypothetical protein